jgi:Flp pilus assembly protein TadG
MYNSRPNPARSLPSSPCSSLSACESGNALVELAFSLPLFLILIAGGSEIANLAWGSVQINNAARAGAAYGSISRANAANTTYIGLAAQNEAPKFITSPSTQVTSTQLCSCVGTDGTSTSIACDTNALSNCASPNVIQVAVKVNTQAPVTPLVHYPGLPASYNVHGQATVGVVQ